jgi:hypothetical protein
MRKQWAVMALAVVAGCGGGSGGGPDGLLEDLLFGREEGAGLGPQAPVVDEVLSLTASPTPGGVIVSSVGLPPTQGWWRAELVRVPSRDRSVYAMEFRLLPPVTPRPTGTRPSREVLSGTFLTQRELAGIRSIAVLGRANSRIVSRQ